jgi:hypothetical protein
MSQYNFRLNLFSAPCTLRLVDTALQVCSEHGDIQQLINLNQVRKIQVYDGLLTSDPETGPYRSEFCKLTFRNGKPLYFRNGFYQSRSGKMGEVAANQSAAYDAFLAKLKQQIALHSPQAVEVSGWLLASLAWWCIFLLGLGFLVIGIAIFWTDELITAISMACFFIPFGLLMIWLGTVIGMSYWPKSRRLLTSDCE